MKRYLAGNTGFTLIELLVGMTIAIILMSAVFGLLSVSLTSSRTGGDKIEAQEVARAAMDAMVREIRIDALDITSPLSDVQADSLTIRVADKVNPAIIHSVTFHRDAKKLYRKVDSDNYPITEETVTALTFDVKHPRTVTIYLTVEVNSQSFSLKTTVVGMNPK